MSLVLHFHPLSSFSHKVLIALYENGTPFKPAIIDPGDAASREAFRAVWPLLKFPVLRDESRGQTVAESTIVIEYLDAFYPGERRMVPKAPDAAWQVRMWDRVFDQYLQVPIQKIVGDALRPEGRGDPCGVEEAKARLAQSYDFLEPRLGSGPWLMEKDFTLADCSAAPALFYANTVSPFGKNHGGLRAYLGRLMKRPSFARVLKEAEPYFGLFPLARKPVIGKV